MPQEGEIVVQLIHCDLHCTRTRYFHFWVCLSCLLNILIFSNVTYICLLEYHIQIIMFQKFVDWIYYFGCCSVPYGWEFPSESTFSQTKYWLLFPSSCACSVKPAFSISFMYPCWEIHFLTFWESFLITH